MLGRDPVVAVVHDADIAPLDLWVAPYGGGAVAVNPMTGEVERDSVRADHDPVVGAVDEIAVEGGVGGDRVAAAHVVRQSAPAAESQGRGQRGCEERDKQVLSRAVGVAA